jgi:hypothetical protein
MLTTLNKELLTKFSNTFLGYGNCKASIWFIGMEPGAPECIELVKKFFDVWVKRGSPAFDDVRESHLQIGEKHYSELFLEKIKYQRTWDGLIKFLFPLDGEKDFTADKVKKYQSEKLGRKDSNHCVIELLPLPTPNNTRASWERFYSNFINSRKEYEKEYLPKRILMIKSQIKSNKPKLILFYGFKYRCNFEQICGVNFELKQFAKGKKLFYKEIDKTLYMLIPHPSRGVANKYLWKVAEFAKQKISLKPNSVIPLRSSNVSWKL